MNFLGIFFRPLNKAGDGLIEQRREDGHGSAADKRSFVQTELTQPLTEAQLDARELATASKQDTANSSLANIDADTLQMVVLLTALLAIDFSKQGTKGAAANAWPVRDDLATELHAQDQPGAGAVLTFNFATAADFLMVDVDNTASNDTATYLCRATLDGSAPSAVLGFVCRSGQTTYLPFPSTGAVKVFAPAGVVVSVQAGKRA